MQNVVALGKFKAKASYIFACFPSVYTDFSFFRAATIAMTTWYKKGSEMSFEVWVVLRKGNDKDGKLKWTVTSHIWKYDKDYSLSETTFLWN